MRSYERFVWALELLPWIKYWYWCRDKQTIQNVYGAIQSLRIAKQLGLKPKEIVDIGCHRGEFVHWWHRAFPNVTITSVDAVDLRPRYYCRHYIINTRVPQIMTLSEILQDIPEHSWLKVDIEESTADALESGLDMLWKIDFAHIEIWPGENCSLASQPGRIFSIMNQVGLTCSAPVGSCWGSKNAYGMVEFCFWRP